MMPEKQADKKHYNFDKYCDEERWASYWCQLKEVLLVNPKSILEIGVGDKVFSSYIKNNTGIKYVSADVDASLGADFLANAEKLPFGVGEFDLVCAFEVLEHLPFDKFSLALGEMHRVTKKYAIISLPHWGRHFSFMMRMPFFKKIKWQGKCSFFPPEHIFGGQHFWEIGKRGYNLKKIKKIIAGSGFVVLKDYIIFDSPYHRMFILKKK